MTITYSLEGSDETIALTGAVVNYLGRHRQLPPRSKEAGGQLFARFGSRTTWILKATGPRGVDRRSRFSFFPNRRWEQREIDHEFGRGLHYVGDWHTHPEPAPAPSRVDTESVQEMVRLSRHELAGFLLLIVGTLPAPAGLFFSIVRSNSIEKLDVIEFRR